MKQETKIFYIIGAEYEHDSGYIAKYTGKERGKHTYEIVKDETGGFKIGDKFTPNKPELYFRPYFGIQSISKKQIIGYRVLVDCTLDYTNFEEGDEIIIPELGENHNWKGTDFFDTHPSIFEPIKN